MTSFRLPTGHPAPLERMTSSGTVAVASLGSFKAWLELAEPAGEVWRAFLDAHPELDDQRAGSDQPIRPSLLRGRVFGEDAKARPGPLPTSPLAGASLFMPLRCKAAGRRGGCDCSPPRT